MDFRRRLAAEALGTAMLAATVVGSGIMAVRLTGDIALALLCNTLATGAVLVVLIAILGPVSGAHLNPAITAAFALRREIAAGMAGAYAAAQVAGGIAGTAIAQLMFARPMFELSDTARAGPPLWLSEAVATFGLVLVVLAGLRVSRSGLPWLIGLYIVAAYWFTASTSFANPALTLARSLSDSFAGIRLQDVPAFIGAQVLGMLAAVALTSWLFRPAIAPAQVDCAGPSATPG